MNRSAQTALSASVVKASTCSTTLDLPLQESIKQRMRRNVSPSAHTDAVEGEREIFPNRKWHHASRVYTLKLTVCLRTLKTLYNLKTRTAPKVSLFFFYLWDRRRRRDMMYDVTVHDRSSIIPKAMNSLLYKIIRSRTLSLTDHVLIKDSNSERGTCMYYIPFLSFT